MGPDIFYFKEGNVMALDRYIALIIAVIFLIYGYTAFFEMDGLLPPILKRNPIWPSTFPKILSVIGVFAALSVVINLEKAGKQVGDDLDIAKWREYKVMQALMLVGGMVLYALTLRSLGFLASTFLFLAGGSILLGERRFIRLVLITAIASYGIWYLVDTVLGIYMTPYPSWFIV
jgi:putative tricarboxylic transport membrane protein